MDEVKPQRPKAQANRKNNNNNNLLQNFAPITTTSFLPNIQIKPINSNSQINPVKLPNFSTVNPVFPIQTTMAQNVQNLNQQNQSVNSKLQPIQPSLNNNNNSQGPINPSDISSIVANLLGNITGNNSKPLNNNFLDSSLDISKILGNNSNIGSTVQPLKLNSNSLKSQNNNNSLSNFTAKTENNSNNFQNNVTNPLINNTGLLTTSNPVKRTANGLKKDGTPRPAKVRRYACPTCQKAFSSFSDLQVHERVHTGVKPFACSVCHKAFSVKSNRRRHERTCHNLCDSPEPPGGKKRKSVKKENNANGNGNLINFNNLNSSMPLLQIPGLTNLTPTTTNNSISNLISTTFSPMVKTETKQNTSSNGTDDAMQILLKTLTSNNDKPITPVKTEAQENQEMVNSLLGIQQTSTPVKSNPSNNTSSENKSEEAMQILLNKITQPELKIEKPKTPESSSATTQPDMVQMLMNNMKSSNDTSGVISESSQANLASCLSSLIQKNDK